MARKTQSAQEPIEYAPLGLKYPCTQCGGDACVGYGKGWNGLVKKGERLCTRCFKSRSGKAVF